ncbi:hypothetical protein IC235_17590 [Hymenobacter sp. BT664]|uniref:Uncharacterized protein n=1 Tax=Hymenobacter montanus TaxID=2771359 RepID=A0A927GL14_9BACT|nr:hypothetical protein [Hymenobacter montanus]MBD2769706.1 hypothetical protein [Hymenobacter montanus]
MSKTLYTVDQLKDMAPDYFASNPDAPYLVASTHDGIFYRPENVGYAQAGADANGGQLVKVTADAEASEITTAAMNVHVNRLAAAHGGKVEDLVQFFATHLQRVANGEEPSKVLTDILAGALPEEELAGLGLDDADQDDDADQEDNDQDESDQDDADQGGEGTADQPDASAQDEPNSADVEKLAANASYQVAKPATTSTEAPAPASTEAAPVAKPARKAAAPKKVAAAKSPKTKTSTKATA